jgi:lipoprotein-anchoring transpeptidase ErfK/SrfK
MQRLVLTALIASALGTTAMAAPLSISPGIDDQRPVRVAAAQYPRYQESPRYQERSNLGGGFIEFLFSPLNELTQPLAPRRGSSYPAQPQYEVDYGLQRQPHFARTEPGEYSRPTMDPRYRRQVVEYSGPEKPGTIVIDTPNKFLYLVQEDGKAIRYGIGVGRPGFTWAGSKTVSMKREWPDWIPPEEMLRRRPDLPRYMPGGPENPLGARALYLGSSLYRIHGSNEPWTIGTQVSSGCIRMRNEDVIDLYERVQVGTRVVVI